MTNKWLGRTISAVGIVILVIGLVGLFTDGDDDPIAPADEAQVTTAAPVISTVQTAVAAAAGTSAAPVISTAPSSATTETATATSAPASSTEAPASTAPPPSATSTPTSVAAVVDQTVEEFVVEYAAAIGSRDVGFLMDSLHPLVIEAAESELCARFIEREILALGNYRIIGEPEGPLTQTIAGTTVSGVFRVPVSFEFQGQLLEPVAIFAVVSGRVRWFTECR